MHIHICFFNIFKYRLHSKILVSVQRRGIWSKVVLLTCAIQVLRSNGSNVAAWKRLWMLLVHSPSSLFFEPRARAESDPLETVRANTNYAEAREVWFPLGDTSCSYGRIHHQANGGKCLVLVGYSIVFTRT
jgi:hypothetical protein